jgi:MbtH protein
MTDFREPWSSWVTVKNDEDQYSIWPSDKEIPAGWTAVGPPAAKDDCLRYISEVWTDMRPRSLREWQAAQLSRVDD